MSRLELWKRRTRAATRVAGPFVVPFLALLVVTAPRGFSSLVSVYRIPILSTAEQAVKVFGGSDSGSLLTAALSWNDIHSVAPGLHWVYTFWPPGMVIVDGVLVALQWSTGIPVVLSMVILNCAVWAVFFGVCYRTIRSIGGRLPAVLFVVAAFLSTAVTSWGTTSGLFYSDNFGAISFCFSILLAVQAARATTVRARLIRAGFAGLFLAGAAYFRASYELISLAALVTCAGVLLVALLLSRIRPGNWFTAWGGHSVLPLGVLSAVAELLMLPWRLYLAWRIHPGDFRWSAVSDLTSTARWTPDQVMIAAGGSFAANGHSNWACINDRVECDRIYALESTSAAPYSGGPDGYFTRAEFDQLTLQSFLAHPFDYIGERFRALVIGFASNDGSSIKVFAIPETILMTVALVAIIVVLVRRRSLFGLPSLFFIGSLLVQVVPLTLMHQEPRYWLGIELGILVMAGLVLGAAARAPGKLFEPPSEVVGPAATAQARREGPDAVPAEDGGKPKEAAAKR